jgi:hypothetical protein
MSAGGFGRDPLFQFLEIDQTMADLDINISLRFASISSPEGAYPYFAKLHARS